MKDNCHSFHPTLSAVGTPTYHLASFLVPILNLLTDNEDTLHDSFLFVSEVSQFNYKTLMVGLDVEVYLWKKLPIT